MDNMITTEELAAKTGYTIWYLRDLARRGLIPAVKFKRTWLFNYLDAKKALKIPDIRKASNDDNDKRRLLAGL